MKFALIALAAGTASAAVTHGCKAGITAAAFEDKDCTKKFEAEGKQLTYEFKQADMNKLNDNGCHTEGGASQSIKCTTKNFEVKTFTTEDCDGKAAATVSYTWGSCMEHKDTDGNKRFFKVTGAMALQSAAIAAVAFVGSQF